MPKKCLFNKLAKHELLALVEAESFDRTPISFYRYVIIENPDEFRDALYEEWSELGVLGRIALSVEGINAQLSVPEHNVDAFRRVVDSYNELKDVKFKIGLSDDGVPFWKLVIKVREYILNDGLDVGEYDVTNVGSHLSAKEFNEAMDDGAIVVDMRNNYESDIGYFEGAIRPDAITFKNELPIILDKLENKKNEKILLYCTGGIRCEKASAYLKHHGFTDVNQLHGGIIDYKHQVDAQGLESKYKGVNYVFDGRDPEVITDDLLGKCYQCKASANDTVNCSNKVCHILFIQCKDCQSKHNGACSDECKAMTLLPEDQQKELRRGVKWTGRVVLR